MTISKKIFKWGMFMSNREQKDGRKKTIRLKRPKLRLKSRSSLVQETDMLPIIKTVIPMPKVKPPKPRKEEYN